MEILTNLNPNQKEAVMTTEGPLLILAGAGSGKTRVLTHRIAYLIYHKNISPWNILAVTFTNKAALEMKERINKLIPNKNLFYLGTFHSIAVKILRKEISALGYNLNFVIYDENDSSVLIKSILKELNLDSEKHSPSAILKVISHAKSNYQNYQDFKKSAFSYFQETSALIYQKYEEGLIKNQALDFDDLINKVILIFQKNPQILNKYQEKFKCKKP
ncbi:MAG: UvrD-helicase domain-containing protein [Armatimonadetes bacterium]|nr:UvrD-helicase domain-containing protein [Armatimonadota bacterium]